MDVTLYPIYQKARDLFERTQEQQIVKGLHKYEGPLNPAEWTAMELIDHAMQELVDGVHYLTALKEKAATLETDKQLFEAKLIISEWKAEKLRLENEQLKEENKRMIQRYNVL
jgi:hypothetical protein